MHPKLTVGKALEHVSHAAGAHHTHVEHANVAATEAREQRRLAHGLHVPGHVKGHGTAQHPGGMASSGHPAA